MSLAFQGSYFFSVVRAYFFSTFFSQHFSASKIFSALFVLCFRGMVVEGHEVQQ